MGLDDKIKNAAEDLGGKAKEGFGKVTGNEKLEAEGQAQQVEADVKKAGENVKAELLRFTDTHPAGSETANRLYDVLLRLAAADGRLDPREYATMQDVTQALGLPAVTLDNKLALFTLKR